MSAVATFLANQVNRDAARQRLVLLLAEAPNLDPLGFLGNLQWLVHHPPGTGGYYTEGAVFEWKLGRVPEAERPRWRELLEEESALGELLRALQAHHPQDWAEVVPDGPA